VGIRPRKPGLAVCGSPQSSLILIDFHWLEIVYRSNVEPGCGQLENVKPHVGPAADRKTPVKGGIVPHSAPIVLLLLAGAGLLTFAALHDFGFRTVPNRISAALLVVGLLLRLLQHDLLWGLACGAIVFVITYIVWLRGWMGGADLKLLTASAVFVAPPMVPTMMIGTSLAGGVLALIYVLGSLITGGPHRMTAPASPGSSTLLRRIARCELKRLRRRGPLPYAAAIAAGNCLAILGVSAGSPGAT
jgi:prepilin peptidase CpaA